MAWNALRLSLEHRFLMRGIEHQLVAVVGAAMAGDLGSAIENAHGGVGGDQGQRAADGFRRDGVIVEIEAHIDGLARAHGLDRSVGKGCSGGGSRRGCSSAKTSATVRPSSPGQRR